MTLPLARNNGRGVVLTPSTYNKFARAYCASQRAKPPARNWGPPRGPTLNQPKPNPIEVYNIGPDRIDQCCPAGMVGEVCPWAVDSDHFKFNTNMRVEPYDWEKHGCKIAVMTRGAGVESYGEAAVAGVASVRLKVPAQYLAQAGSPDSTSWNCRARATNDCKFEADNCGQFLMLSPQQPTAADLDEDGCVYGRILLPCLDDGPQMGFFRTVGEISAGAGSCLGAGVATALRLNKQSGCLENYPDPAGVDPWNQTIHTLCGKILAGTTVLAARVCGDWVAVVECCEEDAALGIF
ncbi:MAG: hypothetical protein KDA60_10835 [Planctomycetales bacterium]|nr:hypothetical protein [Planctomycetales bacterium]